MGRVKSFYHDEMVEQDKNDQLYMQSLMEEEYKNNEKGEEVDSDD